MEKMKIKLDKVCLTDGKKLSLVEGSYSQKNGFSIEIYYCQLCNTTFMDLSAMNEDYQFQWRKESDEFLLQEGDKGLLNKLKQGNLFLSEADLSKQLNTIINSRVARISYCRNDGSKIQRTIKLTIENTDHIFEICVWCGHSSLLCTDNNYGYFYIAFFVPSQQNKLALFHLPSLDSKFSYDNGWVHSLSFL